MAVGLARASPVGLFRPGPPVGGDASSHSRTARPLEHHVGHGDRLHWHRSLGTGWGGHPALSNLGEGARPIWLPDGGMVSRADFRPIGRTSDFRDRAGTIPPRSRPAPRISPVALA